MRDFHAAHHGDVPLLLPNAWDFASAAALAAMGFESIGTTSLGVAAAAGLPDAAGLTRDVTLALARALVALPAHITVDIEGGFSEAPEEVAVFASRLRRSGDRGRQHRGRAARRYAHRARPPRRGRHGREAALPRPVR